ncbi:MAG: SCO family protein [Alphaproteobacteria bacterium]
MPRPFIRVAIIAAVLAIIAAGAALWTFFNAPTPQVTSSGTASVGGPFTLVDQQGRTVTDEAFRGRWMLVFFGFTHCPDVCPTALNDMSATLTELGAAADKVQPIFITVDPARDTVEAMSQYVANFDPRIVALTGTPEQIAQAAKAYRVYYKKVPQGDDYTMDHTGILYLMDPQGRFMTHFTPNTPPADMAARIRKLLG